MTEAPWLLDAACAQAQDSIQFLHRSLPRLGCLAASSAFSAELLRKQYRAMWQTPLEAVWSSCLARELLLLSLKRLDCALDLIKTARQERISLFPFPGGPEISHFLRQRVTAVLIPLERKSSAEFAQLWIYPGAVWRNPEQRLIEFNAAEFSTAYSYSLITVSNPDEKVSDESWKLGAMLAIRAAEQPVFALRLATDWVVSGGMDKDQVVGVGFNAKQRLARQAGQAGRNWLLPVANQAGIADWEAAVQGRVFFARDLESAWAQVSGTGFVAGGLLDWLHPPLQRPQTMHCFVSNALGPMIALVMWSRPGKMIFWASEMMKPKAEVLRAVAESLSIASQIRTLDDQDLIGMREQLLAEPSLGPGLAPVVFNMTGGNLLMRIALLDLARLRPNLHLVYRPEGGREIDYVHLVHPDLRPVAARVRHGNISPEDAALWSSKLLNLKIISDEKRVLFEAIALLAPA
ncbi:MAG: hypothetical protein ACAI35_21550 [Candidatus Methylacidiphilales bacterium]